MFYNGKPLYEAVYAKLADLMDFSIEDIHDDLLICQMGEYDPLDLVYDIAVEFGFDDYINGTELSDYAFVRDVVNYVEEFI